MTYNPHKLAARLRAIATKIDNINMFLSGYFAFSPLNKKVEPYLNRIGGLTAELRSLANEIKPK
jgi:hypothetical protein